MVLKTEGFGEGVFWMRRKFRHSFSPADFAPIQRNDHSFPVGRVARVIDGDILMTLTAILHLTVTSEQLP